MKAEMLGRLWSYRRDVAGAVLYWTGIGRAYEIAARPDGAIVLMYHSISSNDAAEFIDPPNRLAPEIFERQMAFLSKHRCVMPLSQLVSLAASGESPPAGTVCITFDDGYLDNLAIAAPILEKYGLPATLFLATGYISRGETQWADVLYWLLRQRTSDSLHDPSPGGHKMDLSTITGRSAARELLHRRLLEATYHERHQLLTEIEHQLRPQGLMPRLTMCWDDVRELCRRYPFIEIGGHTREHIDLRTHCGEMARAEIDGCAEDIRRELGVPPRYFSFPYSRWCAETREIVRASGWQAAVGHGGNIRIGQASDLYVMPRVDAPRTMTSLRFKTSGAYPGVFSVLGFG